jgi:hypothetical protein
VPVESAAFSFSAMMLKVSLTWAVIPLDPLPFIKAHLLLAGYGDEKGDHLKGRRKPDTFPCPFQKTSTGRDI